MISKTVVRYYDRFITPVIQNFTRFRIAGGFYFSHQISMRLLIEGDFLLANGVHAENHCSTLFILRANAIKVYNQAKSLCSSCITITSKYNTRELFRNQAQVVRVFTAILKTYEIRHCLRSVLQCL